MAPYGSRCAGQGLGPVNERGLPAKSGVGGGVLAVIPQHGTLCAWGPRLGAAGNSVAAIAALDEFTTASGLSVF